MEYQIIKNNIVATFSTVGGEMVSLKKDGTEYVWCGDANYWTGHAPVLFPIVGALVDNKIKIAGEEYTIGKHGFARKSEFTLVEQTANSITFELTQSAETLAVYPFNFSLKITHTIDDNGFATTYKVTNTNDGDMVYCIGGHAGFSCPINEGEGFEDYILEFPEVENSKAYYTDADSILHRDYTLDLLENTDTLPLRHSDFDIDVYIFDDIKSKTVKLLHKDTKKGLNFDFSTFDAIGIWTAPKKQAPYICLEPWAGLPAVEGETGNFEDKPFVQTLKANEEKSYGYVVEFID